MYFANENSNILFLQASLDVMVYKAHVVRKVLLVFLEIKEKRVKLVP